MATKKPRLQVTISLEVRELLRTLSALTGRPAASFVSDMLEGGKEGLVVAIAMLEASRGIEGTAKEALLGHLVNSADSITTDLTSVIRDSLGVIGGSTQAQAGAAAGVGCAEADKTYLNEKGGAHPPSINKGVRYFNSAQADNKGHTSKLLIFKAFSDSDAKETEQ